ncbi:putative F-box/LRR-repeat protein At3g18150 isoform X1 [Pistacia vera]|nr:putative F-box/LRR-repeat protein At3g18150 isoform X1 [Pistacia vera]
MKRIESEVDMLSALPEPLLHHIMSFLSFQEFVSSSVLCKRWMQAWRTYPELEYVDRIHHRTRRGRVMKCFEKILLKRHMDMISICKFRIHMCFLSCHQASFVDRCLCYAIGSHVKELELSLERGYKLPQLVLCSKSIEVLQLVGCKLESHCDMKLPSLRKLTLYRVYADGRVIEKLVAGSPLIEYLKIDFCHGVKSLELSNVTKLSKIKVYGGGFSRELKQLDVNALNVHSISLSQLSGPCEINIAPCKSLKRLKLRRLVIRDEWLCNEMLKLPLLEYLSIMHCNKLESIKISSPSLKELLITECSNLVEVNMVTSNLSRFKYSGDVISFLFNDLTLSQVDLNFHSENIDDQWYAKYTELLAKFHQCSKVFYLRSNTGENVIIPRESRQILRPPLFGVKHLDFTVTKGDKDFRIAELVDGLLWISPHAETISIQYEFTYLDNFSFQFTYKNRLICEGETPHCCESLPVSCWQDCLKEVKIEHKAFRGSTNVKSCSFKDEDILEKIDGLCRYNP